MAIIAWELPTELGCRNRKSASHMAKMAETLFRSPIVTTPEVELYKIFPYHLMTLAL